MPARQSFDCDAVVVGGGPAGASTAFFLADAGLRVVLLDRAIFPRDKACSEYMSPQASRVLAAMGVEDRIIAAGAAQLRGMIVRAPGGAEVHGDYAGQHGFRGFRDAGLALPRLALDDILLRRAGEIGVQIHEGCRVADLLRDSAGTVRGIEATSRNGARMEVRAPIVVGADGLRSAVAAKAGLRGRPGLLRRVALVAHFRGVGAMRDRGEMQVFGRSYLGVAPVGADLANVALVIPHALAREIRGDPAGYLLNFLSQSAALQRRFRQATRIGPVLATGPFARRARCAWAPGVVLVGDAAGFFDPFTGEGIYEALRGGELAAEHVQRYCSGGLRDDELRGYADARRRDFSGKWMVERLIGAAIELPPVFNHLAGVLARKRHMADLLVGVTGDFVPAREVLHPRYLFGLLH